MVDGLKLGDARARRLMGRQVSKEAADRAWFTRQMRRLRSWIDLMLGSRIPSDEKDAVLREMLADVIAGRSEISSRIYETEEDFEKDLRRLLSQHCQALLGGPRT